MTSKELKNQVEVEKIIKFDILTELKKLIIAACIQKKIKNINIIIGFGRGYYLKLYFNSVFIINIKTEEE